MRIFILGLAVFGVGLCAENVDIGNDLSVTLELIKHQPCKAGKWNKKLEFESGNDKKGPKLEVQDGKPNCFTIGGKVEVLEDFGGDFSIYLELKNTAKKNSVPEKCAKQPENGCGGFGSCLYCNACETFGDKIGVRAQLLLDGKPISCKDGLKRGSYDNLKLAFCLPNIEEVISSQGLTKESFLQLIQADDLNSVRAIGVFATVYVFDSDVSKQMATQIKIEGVYRRTKYSFFKDQPLPAEVYWSLPFNQLIKNQQEYVACHRIFGNLKIQKKD
ncbi:unnamed protein product [Caenorhabditis angaria]|uniref:Uncharacterized protein n=1 Tax=Caenorhabditis angaria TaxID=860376 RepID=A0A9P1J4S0_9PELO|nr:unnamed protein product [Caenorhabditis angaria]